MKRRKVQTRKPRKKIFASTRRLEDEARDMKLAKDANYFSQQLSQDELQTRHRKLQQLWQEIRERGNELPLMNTISDENRMVTYRGSLSASVMIIGEAPGKYEAQQGKPFVGPSGSLINQNLSKRGVDIDKHVYVTNLIPVRPPNNRDPTWEEMNAFVGYLRRQIEIVRPKVIMCMGRIASSVVTSGIMVDDTSIQGPESLKVRDHHDISCLNLSSIYYGKRNQSTLLLHNEKLACSTYVSYHPSYLLRTRNSESEQAKKSRTRWDNDYNEVVGLMRNAKLEYIMAADVISDHTAENFPYASPNDTFFQRDKPSNRDQLDYVTNKQSVLTQVYDTVYKPWSNTIEVFGRTREGLSTCTRITEPKFSFYIGSQDILKGEYSERQIKNFSDSISTQLGLLSKDKPKYFSLGDEASNIELNIVERKSFFNYQTSFSKFIEVTYQHYDLLYDLKTVIKDVFGEKVEFFETTNKPTFQLANVKNVYMNGWMEVPVNGDFIQYLNEEENDRVDLLASMLENNSGQQTKISLCDLEYSTTYNNVIGYSPNPNEAGDKKWEDVAPMKVMSIDAEMLNTYGRFPRAEQDPIVNICAYSNTYNSDKKPYYLEKLRDPRKGKSTNIRVSGRCNYDHAAAFIVGSTLDIGSDVFDPIHLPNISEIPSGVLPDINRETSLNQTHEKKYRKEYIVSVRKWNAFIKTYTEWLDLVGSKRARLILKDDKLFDVLKSLKPRLKCENSTNDIDKELVEKWEKDIAYTREKFKDRLTCDISELGSFDEEYGDSVDWSDEAKENTFGTIQSRWSLFKTSKNVFSFRTEHDMLRGFYNYIKQYDPDIITGYNSTGFDEAYFIKRIKVLDLRDDVTKKLLSMGRIPGREDSIYMKVSVTRAYGERRTTVINSPGRVSYDFLAYIQKETKLRDNRLAHVAEHFLGDTKNDVPYSAIPSLFKNNRERLADYCLKDAELVLMLMNNQNNINFIISLVRAIGTISIGNLFVDGQQAKVFSCVYRYVQDEKSGKIFPDINPFSKKEVVNEDVKEPVNRGSNYKGAYVFPPRKKGLCLKLLLCLDYASLYPSIMIAYGLGQDMGGTLAHMLSQGVDVEKECYKTRGTYPNPETGIDEHYYFIKPSEDGTRQSALIGAIKKMLAMRSVIKSELPLHDSKSEEYRKLWAAQLCWKILANSTYGACGVMSGKLAGLHVSAEVTEMGQYHLLELAEELEKKFGARIYGGDTDSVFAWFPNINSLDEIYQKIGERWNDKKQRMEDITRVSEIEDFANSLVPRPMEIEFEKAYLKFFATGKKRAGYLQVMPKWDDIEERMVFEEPTIEFKGLETTRRDSCTIAQNTIRGFLNKVLEITKENREEKKQEAAELVRENVRKVNAGDVNFHEIVQSRALTKSNYTNPSLPHVTICNKKRKRGDPVPEMGNRVPFVVITSRSKKMSESVEDPDYVIENNLCPNYSYINEKKIKIPLQRFTKLMPGGDKMDEIMFGGINKYDKTKNEKKKTFFKKMEPLHKINMLEDDPLAGFVKKAYTCIGCSRYTEERVCTKCRFEVDWDNIQEEEDRKYKKFKRNLDDAMKTCRKCMSIKDTEEVVCGNSTCDQYFPRKKFTVDVQSQEEYQRTLKNIHEEVLKSNNEIPTIDW